MQDLLHDKLQENVARITWPLRTNPHPCMWFQTSSLLLVLIRMVFVSCVLSRAHTIVAINFIQKGKNEAGQMMTKTSIVNLVDLAGR